MNLDDNSDSVSQDSEGPASGTPYKQLMRQQSHKTDHSEDMDDFFKLKPVSRAGTTVSNGQKP
jgi:hypothetical protein